MESKIFHMYLDKSREEKKWYESIIIFRYNDIKSIIL